MRYQGLFDDARAMINYLTGEDLTPVYALPDSATYDAPLSVPKAAQALLERIETMTTHAFSYGEDQAERKELRAALVREGHVPPEWTATTPPTPTRTTTVKKIRLKKP